MVSGSGGTARRARLGYVPAIDGLRAVAVTSVILFHLWPATLPGGFTGVDIFFVISGFVVTASVIDRSFPGKRAFLAWFYARRLMRIMPALIAMLLVTILATQLFVPNSWLSDSVPQVGISAFFGLSNILLATDTDSYFGPQAAFNPFTHTWSLGVEEQFYLVFPLLLYGQVRATGAKGSERRLILLVAALSLASLAIGAVLPQRYGFYLIVSRFWELGAGMLLYLTRHHWQPRIAAAGGAAGAALGAGGLLLVALGFAIPDSRWFPVPLGLLPVLGTVALIASVVALPRTRLAGVLQSAPFVSVGLLSYSLYLWHWPVFVLFRWTVGLHTLPLQLGALALGFVLAFLSYRLVEVPLRGSARIAALPRARVVAGAGAAILASSAVGALLFLAHDRITLSRTRDHVAWYPDTRRPLDPARSHCRVTERVETLAGGKATSWTPEGCTVRPAGFALFAMGDSHNLAYAPAYRQLAADLGVPVRAWFRAGCPLLKLNKLTDRGSRCAAWFAAQLEDFRSRARPGDVLFLPALRQTRYTNQFENDADVSESDRDEVPPAHLIEARRILAQLAAPGVHIVFEAPKPLFRSPPVRCADWFNAANPICAGGLTMPRSRLERRRREVVRAMHMLATGPVRVWDPFPILCPGDTCEAMPNGRPRFLDGDHPSGHGNDVLYPGFRAAMLAARH